MSSNKPFVSVVLCCYNGADVLPDALQALTVQKYSGEFEIIVVDDGSSDSTYEVAKSFKDVRVIRNKQNKGLAGSRNVGIKAAKGEIVAFTDDDCRPHDNWIQQLVAGYTKQVSGVGGEVESAPPDNVVLRYLDESKPLKPLENTLATSKKLTYRLGLYLKGLAGKLPKPQSGKRSVYSLVGANMSFRKEVLEAVGLFDEKFRFGGEEEDLCKRIDELRPGTLYFNPSAKISHQYERSLRDTLRRSQAYGKGSARMFRKHKDINPVIYPFPPVIAASVLLGLVHPALFAVPFVAIPFIYLRWLLLAFSRRSPEAILYAYIQFLQEIYGTIGFIKGWWQFRNLYNDAPRNLRRVVGVALKPLAALALIMGANQLIDAVWLNLITAVCLVLAPGYLLIRLFRSPVTHPMGYVVLSVVGGLAWIMLTGLAAAFILPYFNVSKPLEGSGLAATYFAGVLLLAIGTLISYRPDVQISLPKMSRWSLLLYGLAGILPIMSFVGAGMLNLGQSNIVAISTFIVAGLSIMLALWRAAYLSRSVLPTLLFSVSLSVLWSYSLRSSYLFGWDIQQEFEVFNTTQAAGNWIIGGVHNPYDAMLSLTVLPAVLSTLSGLPGIILFKVFYPLVFSLVPVVLYYAYTLFVRNWVAFVAATISIAQFYYMQQFSALARQQIAFLFFAAIVYLLVDKRWPGKYKSAFVGMLVFGLVVSHYSTTYLTIAMLGAVFIVAKIILVLKTKSIRSLFRHSGYVNWWVVAGLIVGAFVWYGPVTHSSGLARQTAGRELSLNALGNAYDKALAKMNGQHTTHSTEQYLSSIGNEYHTKRTYYNYYPGASNDSIAVLSAPKIAAKPVFSQTSSGVDLLTRYGLWALGLAGAAVLAVKAVVRRFDYAYLEIGLFAGIAGMVFVVSHAFPSIDAFYNIPRLNQQMLMFIALPAVVSLLWILKRIAEKWQRALLSGAVAIFLLLGGGVIAQFAGGSPTANLNNWGSDYQRFYIHEDEVAAASWLGRAYNGHDPVFTDRYAALRLTVPTDIKRGIMYDVTPETIAQGAYVFADVTNIDDGTTMAAKNGETFVFEFPKTFLRNNKNVLYSNGGAEIYR